ncbi:MAG: hypothetical protein ACXU8N_06785 [Telluria sp.]
MYRIAPILPVLLLSACAAAPGPVSPELTVVNALSWDHALSGKRDGVRTAWPVAQLHDHLERFPLAQVKQCRGTDCAWGVLKASRTITSVRPTPGGAVVELALNASVARRQEAHNGQQDAAMAIPPDVPALEAASALAAPVTLAWGKVHRIDLHFGIAYEICVERRGIDTCPVAYY